MPEKRGGLTGCRNIPYHRKKQPARGGLDLCSRYILFFLFLHAACVQEVQKQDEDDQAYELRSSEIESFAEVDCGIYFQYCKYCKNNTHDTFSGDQTGCKEDTSVGALFLLFISSFDLLNDEAYNTAGHDTCT